jgi:S-DNA-T family DNA segregation ATPase FtsK/SpoIIIE
MRRIVTGEQIAQLTNPDPFAVPAWRAPVYRTPGWIIAAVQLARLVWWLARLIVRHPVIDAVLTVLALVWLKASWPGVVALVLIVVTVLAGWRGARPVSFSRWIAGPARGKRRSWFYRRRWGAVMTVGGLAPFYRGRILLPVLGKVASTRYTDRVAVRLVSGQSAADFSDRADNLAHGFGAMLCRVRTARSGAVVLEFVRRDALAAIVPALPIPARPDLRALPVGKREDGLPWLVRLHGTHLLIAGATGAGKASLLWGLVRAMFPLMQSGLVRVLAADPKLMELAFGRAIFEAYGQYAADPGEIADRRPGRAPHRPGRRNHQRRDAREGTPAPSGAAAPLHPAPPGCSRPAPPQGHQPDGREDLHGAGREDVPAVDVPHPHLPQLRAGA